MNIHLMIPGNVPVVARRKALARAKQDFHRCRMCVGAAIRSGDLRAYTHARRALNRSRERMQAWTAVQIAGFVA